MTMKLKLSVLKEHIRNSLMESNRRRFTVTISNHYAFVVGPSVEERRDQEENYGITIRVLDNGDFKVTGPESNLESFAEDICISDAESVADIMRTLTVHVD